MWVALYIILLAPLVTNTKPTNGANHNKDFENDGQSLHKDTTINTPQTAEGLFAQSLISSETMRFLLGDQNLKKAKEELTSDMSAVEAEGRRSDTDGIGNLLKNKKGCWWGRVVIKVSNGGSGNNTDDADVENLRYRNGRQTRPNRNKGGNKGGNRGGRKRRKSNTTAEPDRLWDEVD